MAKEEKDNIVVGLDIGTTKICCIIGEMNSDNTINVIGIGQTPSKGVRKGIISDIEVTIEGIKKAVYDASLALMGLLMGVDPFDQPGDLFFSFRRRGVVGVLAVAGLHGHFISSRRFTDGGHGSLPRRAGQTSGLWR